MAVDASTESNPSAAIDCAISGVILSLSAVRDVVHAISRRRIESGGTNF